MQEQSGCRAKSKNKVLEGDSTIVPYLFKDIMEKDEFFPSGWSHRRWYSGNGRPGMHNKKPRKDVIEDLIEENKNVGGQSGAASTTETIPKVVVTEAQTGEDQAGQEEINGM